MFNFKSLLPIALLMVTGVASMNVSANETALDAQQVAQLIEKADSSAIFLPVCFSLYDNSGD